MEGDAECELASIVPTTLLGIMALLQYASKVEEERICWPDNLFHPEIWPEADHKLGRSWWYFVNRNVVEALRQMTA